MATSVLLACGLNEQKLSNFTFIPEHSGIDGSFLISCILAQRFKVPDSGTILLCLHQNFEHYCGAGMRLGSNLNVAATKGQLKVIEPLKDIGENLFLSKYLQSSISMANKLESLWMQLNEQVDALKLTGKKHLTIIIDDLSALISLDMATENLIIQFCYRLMNEFSLDKKVAIIVKLNTADIFENIASNLELIADIIIRVNRLTSGNFREVDGRLICERMAAKNGHESEKSLKKEMLYKVNDRNVKIFVPGEVGVNI